MSAISYIHNIIPLLRVVPRKPHDRSQHRPAATLRLVPVENREAETAICLRTDTAGAIRRSLEIKVRNELI